MTNFKHSGDLGDIIYSLPTVKVLGGGNLYLDCSSGISDINCINQCYGGKTKFTEKSFNFLKPLIDSQNYVKCFKWDEARKIDYNLNMFRKKFLDGSARNKNHNLIDLHLDSLNLPVWDYNNPWIYLEDEIKLDRSIIVTRTARYQSSYGFLQSNAKLFQNKGIFIGLEKEHEYFEWTFDIKIPYYKVKDALEMAKIIKGSSLFISNATVALAIAIAIGHKNIYHEFDSKSPTTYFDDRKGIIYV